MKIKSNNIFFSKVFLTDPCGDCAPIYDQDDLIRSVVVISPTKIKVQKKSMRVRVDPFKWDSEEQFNSMVIKALLKSCKISNSIVPYIQPARDLMINRGLVISRVLISKTKKLDTNETIQLSNMLSNGASLYSYWIDRVDGLKDNEMILLTNPDFLGVIPIKTDGKGGELYGIGVVNTNGAVLVRSESV